MNELALLHIQDSQYSHCIDNKIIELRLRVAQEDRFDEVDVIYGNKYTFQTEQQWRAMQRSYCDGLFAYYTIRLTLDDVRLVYVFHLNCAGQQYYFSEENLTESYDFNLSYLNAFQMPYINEVDVHKVIPWMSSAVFYEIFVDRFAIGDVDKDRSYVNMKWGDKPSPTSFAGGDIKGIISQLEYICQLGVNALYLTPIFASISNHKYDISDYYNVDSQFGINNDLKILVDKCHDKGIKVILDAVFNHCSDRLPQFVDVIKHGKQSLYFDWFMIEGDNVDLGKVNYQCFGACAYMPKFDTSNLDAQRFLMDIAVHWIQQYDIDGWRLDVSDEVSHNFWRNFRMAVKKVKPDCVIIGENWHDARSYLAGDQFDSIMNYAFTKNIVDFFAKSKITADVMAYKLSGLLMRNTTPANKMLLNLLDSHDTHRLLSLLDGNIDRLKCAIALMFIYVGAPCIFYGTELAMSGEYDPDCRRTMTWEKVGQDNSIADIIRKLSSLKQQDILQRGEIAISSNDGLLVINRFVDAQHLLLYVNITQYSQPITGCEVISHNYKQGMLGKDGFVIIDKEEAR